ncbi:uncharacterized protein RHO25_000360 [Cercospora beticola]|uniref:Uncharacterized protein n=1 Tax=Cercospora beticola TaxID=122368 RepID=A0ABZ0N898_CERBT|nr:hypothetical protein RHO25_000360 [Cercospora beticola]
MAQLLAQTTMNQPKAITEPPGLAECVAEATQHAADPSQFYNDNNLPPKAMVLYDELGNASKTGDLAAVKNTPSTSWN